MFYLNAKKKKKKTSYHTTFIFYVGLKGRVGKVGQSSKSKEGNIRLKKSYPIPSGLPPKPLPQNTRMNE